METNLITYNLHDRGRQFTGKDRNYNVKAIVDSINSAVCQERIKNRDMLGYYGHMIRLKMGMNPQEAKFEGGKSFLAEPSFVTTHLMAYDDGRIEHKAEFLNTDSGKIAYRLYQGRAGGFSSVIDTAKPEFFGFDYVLEPNYTTNRGYTLDSARDITLEDAYDAIHDEQIGGIIRYLDSVRAEQDKTDAIIKGLNVAIENLKAENEEYLSLLSARETTDKNRSQVLDAVSDSLIDASDAKIAKMHRDSSLFMTVNLPRIAETQKEQPQTPFYKRLIKSL